MEMRGHVQAESRVSLGIKHKKKISIDAQIKFFMDNCDRLVAKIHDLLCENCQ